MNLSLSSRVRTRSREESHAMVPTLVAMSLLCLATLGLLAAPVPSGKPGNYPAWWFSRGVIAQKTPTNSSPSWPTNYPTPNDYAVINEGQLKNMATAAYNELVANAPTNVWTTPAGTNLTGIVTGWSNTGNNYLAVNLGQLKTVAKPFYDVLIQIGYTGSYPWTGVGASDFATANIGQAKYAFSFDVGLDSDANGLPDWWELEYLGQLGNASTNASPAGDGYTLAQEYAMGRNPDDYYQGVAPVLAIVSGNNQTNSSGAFVTNALVVQVRNIVSVPLTNAPVIFWSTTGGGLATNTTTAPVSSYQMVRTGTNGNAQIYFQQPLVASSTNTVTVAAGTATNLTFSATTPADTAAPAAPTGVAAVAGPSSGEIDLTWVNHADNATSLIVQQSTTGTSWTTVATLTDVTATTYAVTSGLTSGTSYYFRISAVGGAGTTPSSSTPPIPPGDGAVPRYAVIDLGTNFTPTAMNNSNVVAGSSYSGFSPVPTVWNQGTNSTLLSTSGLSGYPGVSLTGIDDSGHMVGGLVPAIIIYWASPTSVPGSFSALGGHIGGDGSLIGQLPDGASTSTNYTGSTAIETFTTAGAYAYLWTPESSAFGNTNAPDISIALDTSKARGHWAGIYQVIQKSTSSTTALGAVVDGTEYPNETANAVNDSGVAVGRDTDWYSASSPGHAIIFGTTPTVLGTGSAVALNNATVTVGTNTVAQPQIVGTDNYYSGNPILWDYTNPDGTPATNYVAKNINTLLPANSGWTLTSVVAINNSSSIAGVAYYSGSNTNIVAGQHGVLLLPGIVSVYKQGTTAAPTNGLAVKNGDTIELKVSTLTSAQIPFLATQPVWKYQQLKPDGTWTSWTAFGTGVVGAQAEYTTTTSGIFRVEAVFFGDDADALKLVRRQDELNISGVGPMGPGKKGQPDTFGVCDTQIQIDLRNEALSFLGSTIYAKSNDVPAAFGFSDSPANDPKFALRCNLFVGDMGNAALADVPAINGIIHSWPPTANQWAGIVSTSHIPFLFITGIKGWPLLSGTTNPQPGFIIAHPAPGDSGHCAIIDYDGGGIGAGVSGTVNKNYPFYDGSARYRQYSP